MQTTPKQEFKRVEKLKRDSQKLDSDIKKRNQTTKMWSSKRYFQFHMRECNCWKLVRKKLGFLFYLSAKQEWVVFHGFFFVFLQNKNELFFIRFEHYSYYASLFHSRKRLFYTVYCEIVLREPSLFFKTFVEHLDNDRTLTNKRFSLFYFLKLYAWFKKP